MASAAEELLFELYLIIHMWLVATDLDSEVLSLGKSQQGQGKE